MKICRLAVLQYTVYLSGRVTAAVAVCRYAGADKRSGYGAGAVRDRYGGV